LTSVCSHYSKPSLSAPQVPALDRGDVTRITPVVALDFATTPTVTTLDAGFVAVSPPPDATYKTSPAVYEAVLILVKTPESTITPSELFPIADCAKPTTGNVPIVVVLDFAIVGLVENPDIYTGSPFAIDTPLTLRTSRVWNGSPIVGKIQLIQLILLMIVYKPTMHI
jgi:hypothetical protein